MSRRLGAVVGTAVLLVGATGCGGKLGPGATARQLREGTASTRVTCTPGRGDYAEWDYECVVRWRQPDKILGPTSTLGVDVNSTEITDQTAP